MNKLKDKLENAVLNVEASLQKQAADLGEKNIPEQILAQVSPFPLKVLYWREEATNIPNTTVEIWMLQDNSFAVFAGEYDGTWGAENIQVVTNDKGDNSFSNLTDAMKTIRTNYVFDQIPQAPQEEFVASSKIKRLLKKSERNNI